MKVKLFMWLVHQKKILTWENLLKRGFVGPSKCHLWLIGGDDGEFTKPLPLYLYYVGLGGLSLQANRQG